MTMEINSDSSSAGSRKRRATGNDNKIEITLGRQTNCANPNDPKIPCNMALKPGTEYRYNLIKKLSKHFDRSLISEDFLNICRISKSAKSAKK